MDTGIRYRIHLLLCGIFLAGTSTTAYGGQTWHPASLPTTVQVPDSFLLIVAGLVALAIIVRGNPGVRR